jgi:hypothetical protein
MQRLLQLGAVDFGVAIEWGDFTGVPRAVPLSGLGRGALLGPGGQALNTCSSELLAELLRWAPGCPGRLQRQPAPPSAPQRVLCASSAGSTQKQRGW